jgi:hypothetical protein
MHALHGHDRAAFERALSNASCVFCSKSASDPPSDSSSSFKLCCPGSSHTLKQSNLILRTTQHGRCFAHQRILSKCCRIANSNCHPTLLNFACSTKLSSKESIARSARDLWLDDSPSAMPQPQPGARLVAVSLHLAQRAIAQQHPPLCITPTSEDAIWERRE